MQDEPELDEERQAALALENAGLGDSEGPRPDARRRVLDAVMRRQQELAEDVANQADLEGKDGDEGDADAGEAEDDDKVVVVQPNPLPPGVPVVEDDEDSDDAGAGDDASSAGVSAGDDPSAGVRKEADEQEAQQDEQLGGRRYPGRDRAPPDRLEVQFFGRSENSPGDPSLPGLDINIDNEHEGMVLAHLFMQFSLKEGLQKYGARGEKSVMKELGSLHELKAWQPLDHTKLTHRQRVEALSTVVFLEEKRDGRLKTRACVNGPPQRKVWKKEDAASPTPHLESVLLTAGIAAWEGRKVRCFDIPSAFPTADTDEEVITVLKGDLTDLLIRLVPGLYAPYATKDTRGKTILYVLLQNTTFRLFSNCKITKLRRPKT